MKSFNCDTLGLLTGFVKENVGIILLMFDTLLDRTCWTTTVISYQAENCQE